MTFSQKVSTWFPYIPPTSRVLPFEVTRQRFYASLLQWQLFWCTTLISVWFQHRQQQFGQSGGEIASRRWENRAIACRSRVVVCCHWLYNTHKRVGEIKLFRLVLPHLTVLFIVCNAYLPPLRFICFNLLWHLCWSNATLSNLLLLVLLTCGNNNKGKQQGASLGSICFHLEAGGVQRVTFSDLHTAPWRSLLSAFNH